jgi:hypothetical protein
MLFAQVYEEVAVEGSYLDHLRRHMKITITSLSDEAVEFDLKGVAANLANALRRILLSEVPSMAIETVFVHNNTSIIPDEVLAHRYVARSVLAPSSHALLLADWASSQSWQTPESSTPSPGGGRPTT